MFSSSADEATIVSAQRGLRVTESIAPLLALLLLYHSVAEAL